MVYNTGTVKNKERTVKTTSASNVRVGMTILKRVSDGHHYGVVAAVEPKGWDVRIVYTDGEVQVKSGTVIIKEDS